MAMASTASVFFLPLHFLLLVPSVIAFDVTRLLAQFSDFSTFNDLLIRTQLSADISTRKSVTILAVQNGALSSESGQPDEVIKKIIALHVVLDYLDSEKLHQLSSHTAILTTMLQASGRASGLSGFLNVTDLKNGQVAFGSAVPGSPLSSYFVRVILTHPYDISVVQISGLIVPPGIRDGSSNNSSAPTRPPAAAPRKAPPAPSTWPSKAPPPGASPSHAPKQAPQAAAPSNAPKLAPHVAVPPSNVLPIPIPRRRAPSQSPIPSAGPKVAPRRPPTLAPRTGPAPASWPSMVLPPGASPSNPSRSKAPTPARSPSMLLPPGASPSNPPRSKAPAPARWPPMVLPPGASPSNPPRSKAPTAAPSNMAPASSDGAPGGPMPSSPASDAPAVSPPSPVGGGTPPAGSPSDAGGVAGPDTGSGESPASHGMAVVPSVAVAMGAVLLAVLSTIRRS
ncbi:vegetative cell wall protein gp1-like [Musa acuminata AAA Group]|uniref:vegetative cell wall protein gp1-like n=1 Tax=Musa acuminata AAA Group TaxID=214697 RepID=UPI0031E234B1